MLADRVKDIEDLGREGCCPNAQARKSGHPLELEWLHELDADAARQVLMNVAGKRLTGAALPSKLL